MNWMATTQANTSTKVADRPKTAQQHLSNAAIMYAKAGACFEGLYHQQVQEQSAQR